VQVCSSVELGGGHSLVRLCLAVPAVETGHILCHERRWLWDRAEIEPLVQTDDLVDNIHCIGLGCLELENIDCHVLLWLEVERFGVDLGGCNTTGRNGCCDRLPADCEGQVVAVR
jgi:hypothetical protein